MFETEIILVYFFIKKLLLCINLFIKLYLT